MSAAEGRIAPANDDYPPLFARGDHVELAQELVRRIAPVGQSVFAEGAVWRYESATGLYTTVERSELSRIVQGFAGSPVGEKGDPLDVSSSDVRGTITLAEDRIAKPFFFVGAPPGLAFANGFLRLGETLRPHSPENCARAGYGFAYDKNRCPTAFLAFLEAIFRDDKDRVEKQEFVQEFFGAALFGIGPRFQRCIVATGSGSNGKSTLANILLAAMPAGTTSAIAPQDWDREYSRAALVAKRLNVVSELPERDIIASEAFKAIVTGDTITARQPTERVQNVRPIASHYFAANRLPGATDQSDGFWRRFGVLTFNRSFERDVARDTEIDARIIRKELPLIVSWLVEGASRLVEAGTYTMPSSHHAAVAEWRKNADQVALFVEAKLRRLPLDTTDLRTWTQGEMLYREFVAWSTTNGHRPLASNRLAERLKTLGIESKRTRFGTRYPVSLVSESDRAGCVAAE